MAQDTVIGMASSAPAASVGLTLAALAAVTAYGSGPIIILTAIPMLMASYRALPEFLGNLSRRKASRPGPDRRRPGNPGRVTPAG
ncbi:MAG: hypothetical protein ACRDPO_19330 [Streptosporangiaceae bacterium]